MNPFLAPNHTIDSFSELVKPWFEFMHSLNTSFTPKTIYYDSFYSAYNDNRGNDTLEDNLILPGNRLFPRNNWENPAKFNKIFAVLRQHSLDGKNIVGYHQAPRNRMDVDNAVSSAWRHVIAYLISAAPVEGGLSATPEQVKNASDTLTNKILGPWREITPEGGFGGSYLDEANVMEPDWQSSFYGIQYPRVLTLKKKWDPHSVFYGPTAVGSEEWEVRDGEARVQTQNERLCRV